MKQYLLAFLLLAGSGATAQVNDFFHAKADSNGYELTLKGASFLASLPLKCIHQEYPNKTGHVSKSDSDQVLTPRQLHPAFYGCFDWHSSVHGHWMLIQLLKRFPGLPEQAAIRQALNESFTVANINAEVNYFNGELAKGFERTYGWAWVLKLDEELTGWNDADARRWHEALQPLTAKIVSIWMAFLPKQTYPNRTGVHPNTAFGMVFALDYARATGNTSFEAALVQSARRIYGRDKNAPSSWEPDGSDFLSPSLEEADLMRRVLPKKDFLPWFNAYISKAGLLHLTQLPVVSDRTDLQIVHLDGLCFSRSWCMNGLAALLPAGDERKTILRKAARAHLTAALPNVVSGNYGGEHWLASFAVLALASE
ncbi:MAG: DUF2891 domain-containing protein [Bacteroidetes bacterium]|nr:DUF2891 domain-containing protein [Bacteroidota bacterium]